jgi:hypothetical protein
MTTCTLTTWTFRGALAAIASVDLGWPGVTLQIAVLILFYITCPPTSRLDMIKFVLSIAYLLLSQLDSPVSLVIRLVFVLLSVQEIVEQFTEVSW